MQAVLEELLLRSRLIDPAGLSKAQAAARELGCTLAHAVVELGLVSDRGLASLLSQTLKLRVVDPARIQVADSAIAALAGHAAQRLRVLPIRLRSTAEGEFFYVAMSDPTDLAAVRELEALTGREVVPAVVEERALDRALREHYAAEALEPASAPPGPAYDDASEPPPLVLGVLETPGVHAHSALHGHDEDLRAQLLAAEGDDFLTESTDDLMVLYSRTHARAGADDTDLLWLEERREDRTPREPDERARAITASKRAMILAPPLGEELTEPDLEHPFPGPFDDE